MNLNTRIVGVLANPAYCELQASLKGHHSFRVSRLTETDWNGPRRTGTDRNGHTKIPKQTSMGTETDLNGIQWVPKGTRTDF